MLPDTEEERVYHGLDLCSGGGGATAGYLRAAKALGINLEMHGIDSWVMPSYYGSGGSYFTRMDAIDALQDERYVRSFDFIHISPPCKKFSKTSRINPSSGTGSGGKIDLLTPAREILLAQYSDIPWVIENVPEAPLDNWVQMCGSVFPELTGFDERRQLRRHRKFQLNGFVAFGTACKHNGFRPLGVYGNPGKPIPKGADIAESLEEGRKLMGIDWMKWPELTQAIPPAYTEKIGMHLLREVVRRG